MIPKVINYIWLGGGKKSNLSYMCINTWYKQLSDYEIIEWNESNLNLDEIASKNRFFRECRKRKLWAYMADYLRLYILYEYGGIYLDTDVEVIKNFDNLLDKQVFLGYEANGFYGTGVLAAEPHNEAIKRLMDFYNDEIWNVNFYTIPYVFNHVIDNNPEEFKKVSVFAQEYFAPYEHDKEFLPEMITDNTYTVHWYDGSWKDNKQVGVFLQTKHIKNPILRKLMQFKKILGFYKRKYIGN